MKKSLKELMNKSVGELTREKNDLRDEVTKLMLDMKVNKPKNTNQISPKKKRIALISTLLTEKMKKEIVSK